MNNKKLKNIKELREIVKDLKAKGKTVGLITGCFDLIHVGHVKLFRLAKTKVNYLVVGLDNDKTIKLSKGENRPICNFNQRAEVLSEFESVDFVFKINKVLNFGFDVADEHYFYLTKLLMPTALITAIDADKFWMRKKLRADELKVKFIGLRCQMVISTTKIIDTCTRLNLC